MIFFAYIYMADVRDLCLMHMIKCTLKKEDVFMVYTKLIIDGNAVYEIDEECMMQRRKQLEEMERQKKQVRKTSSKSKQGNPEQENSKTEKVNKEKRAFPNGSSP